MSKHVVVIGGGISGLAAAHRLMEMRDRSGASIQITLLEAQDRFGGVIETESSDGFLLEAGPDAFLSEKPYALDLVRKLGLSEELLETRSQFRRSFVVQRGTLVPVPKGFYLIAPTQVRQLFGLDFLSGAGKVRFLFERWIPVRRDDSDESVDQFVRRRFGREALERIGQPMIAGIHAADPKLLSIQATFPRLREMERRYGSVLRGLGIEAQAQGDSSALAQASGPRYSLFVALKGGMGRLIEALVQQLSGVTLRSRAKVCRLSPGRRWTLTLEGGQAPLEGGQTLEADAVCITLPAPQASTLVGSFDPSLSQQLAQIPYESVVTLNMAFRREEITHPLDGFGFVVPSIERRALIGCTFSSNKFPERAPEGAVLLRAFVGGALGRGIVELEDSQLQQRVGQELRQLLGITAAPLRTWIRRYPGGLPQYHVGHLDRVAAIEQSARAHRGLVLTGNAYRGAGIPDCIHQAQVSADRIYQELANGTSL